MPSVSAGYGAGGHRMPFVRTSHERGGGPLLVVKLMRMSVCPRLAAVMCTEQAFTPESEQYAFIERDLSQGVNRTRTPFVVLTGHRPMYVDSTQMCTGKHAGNSRAIVSLIGRHVGVRGADGPTAQCMSTRHSAQVSYGMQTNTHTRKLYRGFVVGHRAVRVVRGKCGGGDAAGWSGEKGGRPLNPPSACVRADGGDQPVADQLQAALEDLMLKYRVDLGMWGHHHSYQRTCQVRPSTMS